MEKIEKTDLRSAAFREILGTPPRWIVQYGTTLAVLGFFIVGLFSYYFTYPDIVKAPIKISTANPPQSVLSPTYGVLENVVAELSSVNEGDVLAVLREDGANHQDIYKLEETVEGLEDFEEEFVEFEQDKSLQLGSVTAAYLSFAELHKQYKLTRVSQYHDGRIDRLNEKIEELQLEIEVFMASIEKIQEDIDFSEGPLKEKYQKNIAKNGPSSENIRLQQERNNEVKRWKIKQDEIGQQIREMERDIGDINEQKLEIRQGWTSDKSSVGSNFQFKVIELKEAIRKWKEEHLINAPISGTLYYADILKSGKRYAEANGSILSVVPTNAEKDIKGKLFVSTSDAIKVQKGQQVNIRFEAYPISKYGLINGVVSDKATLANKDGKKMITIDLENLITTTNDTLRFEHDMQGFAHIITEERPLLFRFFDYFLGE